ncbi:MAG TPA: excinuclease ABC subunit UvrA [Thermoanaerobaculia bacterium]|nr:excinuclease ABC subunit UvrA [Thermoanaerobaculia bacterium]
MGASSGPREPIRIVGARTHNLKNVSVDIPQGSLTVITGVSGSGKSSLAFDTLYAEGQRRYAESMSTYARQFLERLDRPDVDSIEPVPPAIALEQKNGVTNARSTVGTQTEIADAMRLLFAHGGETVCPEDGATARRGGVEFAASALLELPERTRVTLVAPVPFGGTAAEIEPFLPELRRAGFFRVLSGAGEVVEIPSDPEAAAALREDGVLPVVVGRFAISKENAAEIENAVGAAFQMAGALRARIPGEGGIETRTFRRGLFCPSCGREFREPTPALFAFNSPLGACAVCQGFGRVIGIDWDKVIPNRDLTLDERPIAPWNTPAYESAYDDLFRAGRKLALRRHVPYGALSGAERALVEKGNAKFYGIGGFFEWLETKRYKVHVRVLLSRYRAYTRCAACGGGRLVPEAGFVRFRGKTMAELNEMPVGELAAWFERVELTSREREALSSVFAEIRSRLRYLDEVGLDYLTLSRAARTLSGGEAQRIGLACALGGALTNTLYVLDEPTIGLHARDTGLLLSILRKLADRGNTVAVVEHDPDVIAAADRVVDLGPEAGARGGSLLFSGTPTALRRLADNRTAAALRRRSGAIPAAPGNVVAFRRGQERAITIVGAREHNLKNLTVRLPLGRLVSVTGVSGSGKSTLLKDCFFHVYQRRVKGVAAVEVGAVDEIRGLDHVSDVLFVDQTPLGRSARSNPVTYTKAYDEIRHAFASTGRARAARVTPRDFSFNTPGGRCEACQGTGVTTIDMQFLADVVVTCDRCDGRRFSAKVLAVRYRGKNIDDVLRMTVAEAMAFFADLPKVTRRLAPLAEVGLAYLPLGQPTSTLSGGEAQRLKLASFLEEKSSPRGSLFLFDEPTTGLHTGDVDVLLGTFRKLIARGHSIVAIEHHLDFVAASDWVIDLGPGGGARGGEVVAEGTPAEIAAAPKSETGRFLARRAPAERPHPRARRAPR